MERDIDTEFRPSESLSYTCNNSSSVHIDNLFTQIETHTETKQFSTSCRIAIEKVFYIDSLKSSSIVLDDDGEYVFFLGGFYYNNRVFFIEKFYGILQEIGDNLLKLYLIDFYESHIFIDEVDETYVLMYARVYFVLCPKKV